MATLNVPSKTYTPGTYTVGPVTLASTDNYLLLTATGNSWPQGATATITLLGSSDGGATWFTLLSSVASGYFQDQVALNPTQFPTGEMTITVAGGSITAALSAQTSPTPLI
jgi:hypothetical protein